ncbi:MAG: tRNA1(Val) (adenine(37)-N6)-methyltransferase [Eubacterium sp.]|nr:tRNA1(Val) (adenine(37)-N6)-methyltransferase [Eubacterium sp.]
MSMEIREGETCDDLQNGLWILQSKKGFRFGIDAVLLADFAGISPAECVLDLGCGSGILPLLLCARSKGKHITGLELQTESAALAARNVSGNRLEDRVSIIQGDLREAGSFFGAASFDAVVSNPPYMLPSQGKVSPNPVLAAARHEICCTFADVASAAACVLKKGGRFFLVHRAVREEEILQTLKEHALAPLRLRRVQPFAEKPANLILVEAEKGGIAREMSVEDPLVVYEKPGVYTEEILKIYRMTGEE